MFGEWYQKTNKTEDTNKLTLLAVTAAIQERVTAVLLSIPKEAFSDSFQKLYERCQPCVVKDDYFEGQ
jgi:methylmalonyl-CoA mutase cobalamin-binding subunit